MRMPIQNKCFIPFLIVITRAALAAGLRNILGEIGGIRVREAFKNAQFSKIVVPVSIKNQG